MANQTKRYTRQGLGKARGVSMPFWGTTPAPALPWAQQPSSLNPLVKGFFYGGFSTSHDGLLTQFPTPLISLENGGWGPKFQVSKHGMVFSVTSPHLGAHPQWLP